jgi:hypothetical protein
MRDQFGNTSDDYDPPRDLKDILLDRRWMDIPNIPEAENNGY